MLKILVAAFLIIVLGAPNIQARPLNTKDHEKVVQNKDLKNEMDKMIISIADLDILVNRDKVADYEIFIEDAERILTSVQKIRSLDKEKVFKPFLDELEDHAEKLLKYSKKKDERAMKYPEKIFNACFKCHQKNRKY